MKKRMIAVLLLLCLALAAVSCNPNSPYELLTNENGETVTVEKNDENNNNGDIKVKEFDDEEAGYRELKPIR